MNGQMRSLSVFLPRLVALTVAWLLATTALTYAAAKRMVTPTTKTNDTPIAPQAQRIVVVPDVRRQPSSPRSRRSRAPASSTPARRPSRSR
jgi:hypothetical protein